jgi:phage tail-like protein
MATPRKDRPYAQFNFTVSIPELDGWNPEDPAGGFQEVSGLGIELTLTEYRTGNEPRNAALKVATLAKASDVTFKRGIMATTLLYGWLDEIRRGAQARKTVVVTLRDETGENDVLSWTLENALIMKTTFGPLSATGTEILMEELVLGCEWLTMR